MGATADHPSEEVPDRPLDRTLDGGRRAPEGGFEALPLHRRLVELLHG